jgi:protein ImuB
VETVAFAAVGLAEELCGRIASAGLACTRLRIEAETEDGETVSRVWRGDRPFATRSIVDRVRWQLEGWAATGGIAVLRLVVEEAVRGDGRQLGFSGEVGEADLRAERGLARVQGLLGHEAVLTAVVGGGRGPGDQVSFVPWGTSPAGGIQPVGRTGPVGSPPAGGTAPTCRTTPACRTPPARTPPWPGRLPPPAPAVVHTVAIPVEVVDCSYLPVRVSGRGQLSAAPDLLLGVLGADAAGAALIREGKVAGWAGPWLTDERWWDLRLRRRRARMQVLLVDGSAHLLVLEGGRWGVEATYD